MPPATHPFAWFLAWLPRLGLGALALLVACASAWANTPGKNGTRTIATINTIVNQSTTLSVAAAAGASTITVANIANLTNSVDPAGTGPLAPGDVILIYQARGATINTDNSVTYGDITDYGNAGNYEFQSVASVSGNNIGLAARSDSSSCTAGTLR